MERFRFFTMNDLQNQWYEATNKLLPGEQAVFRDILQLTADEKKQNLVYNSDYSGDGGACLVNAAGVMLAKGDGHGVPMAKFGEVVSLYDHINSELEHQGVNTTPGKVSPLAAEILLQWFAPEPESIAPVEHFEFDEDFDLDDQPYVERTDEEMAHALNDMLSAPEVTLEIPKQFDDLGWQAASDPRNADV